MHAGEVAPTASRHAREVEDAATASKCAKNPPPAQFCTRRKWRRQESTSGSLCKRGRWRGRHEQNARKDHLRLAFAGDGGEEEAAPLKFEMREEFHKGGGGGGKSTSSSFSHTREVEDTETVAKCDSSQPPYRPCMRGRSAGCVRGRCINILTCFEY